MVAFLGSLNPCRSWQQDLEDAQNAYKEHKAKVEEQSNLHRKLVREIKEAKVSIYLLYLSGGVTLMLSIGRMVPDELTGS